MGLRADIVDPSLRSWLMKTPPWAQIFHKFLGSYVKTFPDTVERESRVLYTAIEQNTTGGCGRHRTTGPLSTVRQPLEQDQSHALICSEKLTLKYSESNS